MKKLLILSLLTAQLSVASQSYTGSANDNAFIGRELNVSPDVVAQATAGHSGINVQRAMYLTRQYLKRQGATGSGSQQHQQQPSAPAGQQHQQQQMQHLQPSAPAGQTVSDEQIAGAAQKMINDWKSRTGLQPDMSVDAQAVAKAANITSQETSMLGRLGGATKSKHKKRTRRA